MKNLGTCPKVYDIPYKKWDKQFWNIVFIEFAEILCTGTAKQ